MKRLIISLAGFVSLLAIAMSSLASAAVTWTATISQLPTYTTSRQFNVQYTVLSISPASFCVELLQTAPSMVSVGTQQVNTTSDPHATNGNSGTFAVNVASDGTYQYELAVTPGNSCAGSGTQTFGPTGTIVDTTPPSAPGYGGKTQSGNTYTLTFTAPKDTDVNNVQIFASTSKTYTADSSTRVGGPISVTPGQTKTFSYTAPDSATRYFSLEAFDNAGNGSAMVGDPGTVVHPVVTVVSGGQGGGAATTAAAGGGGATGTATTGQVQGASTVSGQGTTTVTGTNGNINAGGSSSTSKQNNKGKVLGAATVNHRTRNTIYSIIGAVIVLGAILYYLFFTRRNKSLFPNR